MNMDEIDYKQCGNKQLIAYIYDILVLGEGEKYGRLSSNRNDFNIT